MGTTINSNGVRVPEECEEASVSFAQSDGEIWFNGACVPWKDAKIHVLTHGLHYASALFEGERAHGGRGLHDLHDFEARGRSQGMC